MDLTVSDWSLMIDALLTVTAVLFPAIALYAAGVKKAKDQLVKVLNQTPVDNHSILKIAEASGLKNAAQAISKLL